MTSHTHTLPRTVERIESVHVHENAVRAGLARTARTIARTSRSSRSSHVARPQPTDLTDAQLPRGDDFEAFMSDRQRRLLSLIKQATGKAAYTGETPART